ncbi:MAG: hypothetical protein LBM26_03620 [Methanobrevibacter sp.]|jgi:hypothetical protein|nr:hypothetical protein [Methanobrevibacter sp.]
MDKELFDEISQEIAILINSGFFNQEEILEIIEEQFIDEDFVDDEDSLDKIANIISKEYDEKIAISKDWEKPTDFDKLKTCFNELNQNNIIAIHNAGYDIKEGIADSFEIFHYLKSKKFNPIGFCFYTFEDIEIAIDSNSISFVFGDFDDDPKKSEEIGNIIAKTFKNNDFLVKWDNDINEKIAIDPFIWKKHFDNEEYEMEGAFNYYLANNSI